MTFQITALILTAWLMTVTLVDPNRGHFLYWAALLILIWSLVNIQRTHPWTTNNILQATMYLLYIMVVLNLAILIGSLTAYLLFLELVILIAASMLLRNRTA